MFNLLRLPPNEAIDSSIDKLRNAALLHLIDPLHQPVIYPMVKLRVVPRSSQVGHTAQRRATVALACLRMQDLAAGDWIRLSTTTTSGTLSSIAQVWPSLALSDDEIVISRTHSLILGEPEQLQLEKLDLKNIKWMTAKSVSIKVEKSEAKDESRSDKGTEREAVWNLALLKEVLRECFS